MAEISGDIIRRAQLGDRAAFTDVVVHYQHYVYSIAMSIVKDPSDAEDLTQEVFIRLLRTIAQYNGDSRFSTWLYRLVINLGRDELRRRSRRIRPELHVQTTTDTPDPVVDIVDDDRRIDPLDSLMLAEMRREMRQAMLHLDENYRIALTLHYFDDMKYDEIANIMNIPLNTVKSHIRRGKERLMAIIQKNHSELLRERPNADVSSVPTITMLRYCGESS